MACSLCEQLKLGRIGNENHIPFKVISKTTSEKAIAMAENKDSTTFQLLNLPIELILLILSRLPIKSLLRCRLVFKQWNLLTRTSEFTNLYNEARILYQPLTFAFPSITLAVDGRLNSLFIIFQTGDEIIRIPFEKKFNFFSYSVYSSCNGFLLLSDKDTRMRIMENDNATFIIYNPITKETIFDIPCAPKQCHPNVVSFGFDAKTNEYKLVLDHKYIITLGQSCWRKLSPPSNLKLENSKEPPVFINGAFYWIHVDKDVIISLDIYTEKYRTIQGVVITLEDPKYRLMEYDNKLAYAVFDLKSQELQIWSLEDDQNNNKWIMTKLLRKQYCDDHEFDFKEHTGNYNYSLLFYHFDTDSSDMWEEWYRTFIEWMEGGHCRVFHFVPNIALLRNP